jgi:hypothetical protein
MPTWFLAPIAGLKLPAQNLIYRIRGTRENHRIIHYNYVTEQEEPDIDSFSQQEKFGEHHRILQLNGNQRNRTVIRLKNGGTVPDSPTDRKKRN